MTKRKAPQWQFPGYVCKAIEFGLGGGGLVDGSCKEA